MELSAGGIERALLILSAVVNERAAVLVDRLAQEALGRPSSWGGIVVEVADDLSSHRPEICPHAGESSSARGPFSPSAG
jgi:hypothetical protein